MVQDNAHVAGVAQLPPGIGGALFEACIDGIDQRVEVAGFLVRTMDDGTEYARVACAVTFHHASSPFPMCL